MATQIGRFGVANSSTTRFFPRGLRGLRAFSGNPLRKGKLRLSYQNNEMLSITKLWLECYALKTGHCDLPPNSAANPLSTPILHSKFRC